MCRFVVTLTAKHDYFFYLYLAYVACQVLLAAIGLFHYPNDQSLQALDLPYQTEYSVSNRLLNLPAVLQEAMAI